MIFILVHRARIPMCICVCGYVCARAILAHKSGGSFELIIPPRDGRTEFIEIEFNKSPGLTGSHENNEY